MNGGRLHTGALISGLLFTVLGTVFLLDRLEVIEVRVGYVWPTLLIVIGVAILLGGRRGSTAARPSNMESPRELGPPS